MTSCAITFQQTLQSGAESATSEVSRLSAAVAASECSLAAAQAQWTTERAGLLAQLEQAVARVASLQSEVQHMHGLLDSAAQKSQDEKHQLANALAAAQATAAQGVDQLQPLRAQVQK